MSGCVCVVGVGGVGQEEQWGGGGGGQLICKHGKHICDVSTFKIIYMCNLSCITYMWQRWREWARGGGGAMDTDIQSRTDRKTEKDKTQHREREQTKSAGVLPLAKIQQNRGGHGWERQTDRQTETERQRERHTDRDTLQASLSGAFLQILPDLVTPLKGHSLSLRSCPAMRSAPSERFWY